MSDKTLRNATSVVEASSTVRTYRLLLGLFGAGALAAVVYLAVVLQRGTGTPPPTTAPSVPGDSTPDTPDTPNTPNTPNSATFWAIFVLIGFAAFVIAMNFLLFSGASPLHNSLKGWTESFKTTFPRSKEVLKPYELYEDTLFDGEQSIKSKVGSPGVFHFCLIVIGAMLIAGNTALSNGNRDVSTALIVVGSFLFGIAITHMMMVDTVGKLDFVKTQKRQMSQKVKDMVRMYEVNNMKVDLKDRFQKEVENLVNLQVQFKIIEKKKIEMLEEESSIALNLDDVLSSLETRSTEIAGKIERSQAKLKNYNEYLKSQRRAEAGGI